jgi:hypothetical protein
MTFIHCFSTGKDKVNVSITLDEQEEYQRLAFTT